jgi:hypothetical protein
VTLQLARLGVEVPNVPEADIAELPDLGRDFNDVMAWNALVADAKAAAGPEANDL